MSDRPEWIACVFHTHADKKLLTWCGRPAGYKFLFTNIDHAAYNAMAGGRLVACPECVAAIVQALGGAQ